MLQAYKYRMYPSQEQAVLLMKHIHACRFVYNHSLEQKIKAYEQEGQKLYMSGKIGSVKIPAMEKETAAGIILFVIAG